MATTPFPFVSGTTLTASQLNSQFNVPINAQTVSYVLVAADGGKRVQMNAAGNTTITVNTGLFAAGDSLFIQNINATGTTTITAGTCTVTTAGSLAVAPNSGGQLYFTAAATAIYFPSGVTATAAGLTLITAASFSAAATVSLPANTFSATYQNYLIHYSVTAASVDSAVINCRLRAAGTDSSAASYSNAGVTYQIGAAPIGAANILSGTSWQFTNFNSVDRNKVVLDIQSPQVAADTHFFWSTYGRVGGSQGGGNGNGEFRAATQFDSLTLFPATGTITGNYKVYGYTN